MAGILFVQQPIHDVAPSAVSTADAIETINCVTNLIVSLFVITYLLSYFNLSCHPEPPFCHPELSRGIS